MEVEVTEPEGLEKDEILLIHGFPDSARLWDKQVECLSKEGYRCINVTLPNFGIQENRAHWGYSFPQIHAMLTQTIEKHSKGGKVTLLTHDFGSTYGMDLQSKRPDLVRRIATIDNAGHMELSRTQRLYHWS